jgi:hypothetical protein
VAVRHSGVLDVVKFGENVNDFCNVFCIIYVCTYVCNGELRKHDTLFAADST